MPNEFSKRTDPSDFDPDRGWFQITTDIASHLPFSAAVEANPARTTITSCLTAAIKFEIDVIAVRPT